MSEVQMLSAVGRLVQGSAFVPNDRDAEGRPLLTKNGPNAGQPRVEYYMGVAFPKNDPWISEFFQAAQGVAQQAFPGGQFNSPGFAWKFIDGDGTDANGQPNSQKEGFAGNYVLKFSGGFAPKCYSRGGESVLTDPESIKRGYYIRVYFTIRGNNSTQRPGIYLNPSMVELIGYGEEIISGPDGSTVFGGAPVAQLPPGASATPLAPTGAPMAYPAQAPQGMPPAQAPQGMPPAQAPQGMPPAQGVAPGVPPGTMPHPQFNNGPQQ